MQRPASRRLGPGVRDWREALLVHLLTLWWKLLEIMLEHWVSSKTSRNACKKSLTLFFHCCTRVVGSGFSVEGPSQAKIECDDKGDGSCDVRYWPTEAGEYAVHVLCNNEDIQHSPFMAEIVNPPAKDFYPDKVRSRPKTRQSKEAGSAGLFEPFVGFR